jgi:hypothetical protein
MPALAMIERPRGEGMQEEWGTANLGIS